MFFAIEEPHQRFECAIVRKVYTYLDVNEEGDVVVKLSHDDTNNLLPGEYYYEVKLLKVVNGVENLDTVITRTKLHLLQ